MRAAWLTLLFASQAALAAEAVSPVAWREFSDASFADARKSGKLLILDLEAVWCHWCHVMDEKTYRNAEVAAELAGHYVALKADQDSRPDLSAKYGDYGWPATIFFDSHGRELAYRQGYVEPKDMLEVLSKLAKNPKPEDASKKTAVKYATNSSLPHDLETKLEKRHLELYDPKNLGWGTSHKYLDWLSVEYSLLRGARGDARQARMARETLQSELALLDPVWGGVFQYSTDGDWNHPHFEKIMEFQAGVLGAYAHAYMRLRESQWLKASQAIREYLKNFLTSPDGAFYVSQDADLVPGEHSADFFALNDEARRARGIPRVDKHVYARENGWAIEALCMLYGASGDDAVLADAKKAAEAMLKDRGALGGGFRHDDSGKGLYLGDTLAVGRAFLALYSVTGDRSWLVRVQDALAFIDKKFQAKGAGYMPSYGGVEAPPQRGENIELARFANLVSQYTGKKEDRAIAERAMRFLATPSVALDKRPSGVLLAAWELSRAPVHVTIVGHKDDPAAQALFKAALLVPEPYRRIDWWDKREGPMVNPDVQYPELKQAAAFACAQGRCSLPALKPEDVAKRVAKFIEN